MREQNKKGRKQPIKMPSKYYQFCWCANQKQFFKGSCWAQWSSHCLGPLRPVSKGLGSSPSSPNSSLLLTMGSRRRWFKSLLPKWETWIELCCQLTLTDPWLLQVFGKYINICLLPNLKKKIFKKNEKTYPITLTLQSLAPILISCCGSLYRVLTYLLFCNLCHQLWWPVGDMGCNGLTPYCPPERVHLHHNVI